MSSVPYLYINIAALCCFTVLFVAFFAAKKTPEIKWFLIVMGDGIIWVGGSILMRLQVWPGLSFWYYVSLEALFAFMPLLYMFVCRFAKVKGYFLKLVWSIGAAIILLLTPFGLFLSPPTPTVIEGVGTVFAYDTSWQIAIPYAFFVAIALSILLIFVRMIREQGISSPGLPSIIIGCGCLAIGNIVQIFPGNIFPFDTLSGAVFVILVMVSLTNRRMFHMQLLISRNVLMLITLIIFASGFANLTIPLERLAVNRFGMSDTTSSVGVLLVFTVALITVYFIVGKLIDSLFTREEQQNKVLKTFSAEINQSLNAAEIMEKLVRVIKSNINTQQVYICLQEGDSFVARHSFNPLAKTAFSIEKNSPAVISLSGEEPFFLTSEFRRSYRYLSMWDAEKELLDSKGIACVAAMRDGEDVIGLVMLTGREQNSKFTYADLSFLTTVCSMASIAMKNAILYEKMYREARIDSLTGLYNYRFFVESLEQCFNQCRRDTLALAYLDLDDFKLYNQLYGANEGDWVLRQVSQILSRCAGENDMVFRTSGKVFALLLPHYDPRQAYALVNDIKERVAELNSAPERAQMRGITVSCGICVSPMAAATAKELSENADLAVYYAKTSGKNKIVEFQNSTTETQSVYQRAMSIVTPNGEDSSRYSSALFALTAAIDAKDHYTANHSLNVAQYSAVLATAIGMADEQVRVIYEAGLLHDIGKISIPEQILNKHSGLTNQEYDVMQGHVNNSIEIIRHLPSMDYLIPAAIGHHERWDGSGYPRGLSGHDIPIPARCLALADAFDAMTTDRPYRKALSLEYAAEQIRLNKGTQFDPDMAEIFIELAISGELVGGK